MKYLSIFLLLPLAAAAFDWPEKDVQLDRLLRERSARYKMMAEAVESRQGFRIETAADVSMGRVCGDKTGKGLIVQLNPDLRGDRRASVLIWEMANAYQRPRFDEIDKRARDGVIASHQEFGLRMELIEYDSFRHHREVLLELQKSVGPIGPSFLFFLVTNPTTLDKYSVPYAHDYIEAQAKSGHTRTYEKWYYIQTGKPSPFEK